MTAWQPRIVVAPASAPASAARVSNGTSCPALCNSATFSAPTNPVPPVTATFIPPSAFRIPHSIQSVFLNPRLWDGAEAQEPVVELLQTPAAAGDEPLVQARIFQTAQP